MIDDSHVVVYLDPTDEDYADMNDEIEWTKRALSILSSEQSHAFDKRTKAKIENYVHNKLKAITQQNTLDAINITTNRMAEDMEKQFRLDNEHKKLDYLLGRFKNIVLSREHNDNDDVLSEEILGLDEEEVIMNDDAIKSLVTKQPDSPPRRSMMIAN